MDDQNRKDYPVPACRPASVRRGGRVGTGEQKREDTRTNMEKAQAKLYSLLRVSLNCNIEVPHS